MHTRRQHAERHNKFKLKQANHKSVRKGDTSGKVSPNIDGRGHTTYCFQGLLKMLRDVRLVFKKLGASLQSLNETGLLGSMLLQCRRFRVDCRKRPAETKQLGIAWRR